MRTLLLGLLFSLEVVAAKPVPALPKDFIFDEAGVISTEQRNQITEWLTMHETATTDQIAVAVFKSLEGEDLVAYTSEVFKSWSLGQRKKDNGVLLAVYVADRKVRIEVGYGMEELLTDRDSKQIIDDQVIPWFKKGSYEKGVAAGVVGILTQMNSPVLNVDEKVQTEYQPVSKGTNWLFILIILVFFFFTIIRHPLLWILSSGATYGSRGISRGRSRSPWYSGGMGGGGFGGGIGGGGRSGGGGASGSW